MSAATAATERPTAARAMGLPDVSARWRRACAACLAALALAGCTVVGPDYRRPDQALHGADALCETLEFAVTPRCVGRRFDHARHQQRAVDDAVGGFREFLESEFQGTGGIEHRTRPARHAEEFAH